MCGLHRAAHGPILRGSRRCHDLSADWKLWHLLRRCGIYKPWLGAFIVRSVSGIPSNFRCDVDLDTYLKQNKVPGMYGIDTRALTRVLRESGTMRGMISYGEAIGPGGYEKSR